MVETGLKTIDYKDINLDKNLESNIKIFKDIFKKDAVLRIKTVTAKQGAKCALLYMDGMVNIALLNDSIVRPLLLVKTENVEESFIDYISNQVLFASESKKTGDIKDILRAVMYGDTLLLIDGCDKALTINTKGWRTRGVSEPENERVLKGPREGFDEAGLLNLAMIRRRLQTPDLCIELMRVGRRSDTQVYICYLGSLVDQETLKELKKRLKKIDMDGILDSNYITEQIRDCPHSFFKTTGSTERPDIIAARLLEGRIALVVDGTPVAVTLPYLFSENFQSDEDYYLNYLVSLTGRVLRYICFFLSISVPAVFVALMSFHKELMPTSLILAITQLRGGVPFSVLTECLLLILVFEILRETGVRMAQSLGHALSIVGGLVVGDAAVSARIISAPMLIAIAISGIAGLMVPRVRGAVFYMRLILVFLASLLGLYGYVFGISIMIIQILKLNSFGVSSTVSLDRASSQSMKDIFWRVSWKKMIRRPDFNRNIIRMGKDNQ